MAKRKGNYIEPSTKGYKKDSPDRDNPYNVIPSGNITMKDVPHPVFGIDNWHNMQLMMPGGEYKFPGSYVFEIPIKQTGGGDEATRADSLALLKNAQEVQDYYMYSGNYTTDSYKPGQIRRGDPLADFMSYGRYIGPTGQKTIPKAEDFRKDINPYQYMQRETESSILDTRAPMSLYDTRIQPQGEIRFENIKEDDPLAGDISRMNIYQPLAITPWVDLNPKQQKERVQTYGTSGTPYADGKDLPEGWRLPLGTETKTSKPVRTTPDPKRSVVDNLNTMGEDSSFSNRKKLYEESGGTEDYRGTAAQNEALNQWLHDDRPIAEKKAVPDVKPDVKADGTKTKKKINESMTSTIGGRGLVKERDPLEPVKPKEYLHQKPGAWYTDPNTGELKQWYPKSAEEHQRPPGQEVILKQEGGKAFSPHMMYNPESGMGYLASTYEDHLRMKSMGYGHEEMAYGGEWTKHVNKSFKKMALTRKKALGGSAAQNMDSDDILANRKNVMADYLSGQVMNNIIDETSQEAQDAVIAAYDGIMQMGGMTNPYLAQYQEMFNQRGQDWGALFGATGNMMANANPYIKTKIKGPMGNTSFDQPINPNFANMQVGGVTQETRQQIADKIYDPEMGPELSAWNAWIARNPAGSPGNPGKGISAGQWMKKAGFGEYFSKKYGGIHGHCPTPKSLPKAQQGQQTPYTWQDYLNEQPGTQRWDTNEWMTPEGYGYQDPQGFVPSGNEPWMSNPEGSANPNLAYYLQQNPQLRYDDRFADMYKPERGTPRIYNPEGTGTQEELTGESLLAELTGKDKSKAATSTKSSSIKRGTTERSAGTQGTYDPSKADPNTGTASGTGTTEVAGTDVDRSGNYSGDPNANNQGNQYYDPFNMAGNQALQMYSMFPGRRKFGRGFGNQGYGQLAYNPSNTYIKSIDEKARLFGPGLRRRVTTFGHGPFQGIDPQTGQPIGGGAGSQYPQQYDTMGNVIGSPENTAREEWIARNMDPRFASYEKEGDMTDERRAEMNEEYQRLNSEYENSRMRQMNNPPDNTPIDTDFKTKFRNWMQERDARKNQKRDKRNVPAYESAVHPDYDPRKGNMSQQNKFGGMKYPMGGAIPYGDMHYPLGGAIPYGSMEYAKMMYALGGNIPQYIGGGGYNMVESNAYGTTYPEDSRLIEKRKMGINPEDAVNWTLAGANAISSAFDTKAMLANKEQAKNLMTADATNPVFSMEDASRGTYDQFGNFIPDDKVAVQNSGVTGMGSIGSFNYTAKYGGKTPDYKQGGSYDIDDRELQRLKSLGYEFEYED